MRQCPRPGTRYARPPNGLPRRARRPYPFLSAVPMDHASRTESTPRILRIFRITGLGKAFTICPSIADAVTADPHWRKTAESQAGSVREWCRSYACSSRSSTGVINPRIPAKHAVIQPSGVAHRQAAAQRDRSDLAFLCSAVLEVNIGTCRDEGTTRRRREPEPAFCARRLLPEWRRLTETESTGKGSVAGRRLANPLTPCDGRGVFFVAVSREGGMPRRALRGWRTGKGHACLGVRMTIGSARGVPCWNRPQAG